MLKKIKKLSGKLLAWCVKHENLVIAIINLIAALITLYCKVS